MLVIMSAKSSYPKENKTYAPIRMAMEKITLANVVILVIPLFVVGEIKKHKSIFLNNQKN